MPGVSEPFAKLITWCGSNYLLLSACELGIGLLPALAVGYLGFWVSELIVGHRFRPLAGGHFALLFACVSWEFFTTLLSVNPDAIPMYLRTAFASTILLAPISIFAGIPALLIYLLRRPVLNSQTIYIVAASILASSVAYRAFFEAAYRDGS
jgi:hypothetical protein